MSTFRSLLSGNIRLACFITLLIPLIVLFVDMRLTREQRKIWQRIILALSILLVLKMTLLGRMPEVKQGYNLTPFWSYSKLHDAEYRWEIILNILLFIPFGFLLAWAWKRELWQVLCIAFFFSISIEALQFFFKIGFCEFDDVFHNTLGACIGYGYLLLLSWIEKKFGGRIRNQLNNDKCALQRKIKKLLQLISLHTKGNKKE